MEPIYGGLARRARATLGVTGWGMQLMTLPPNWDGYPNHRHDASVEDSNQEEVYRPSAAATHHSRQRGNPVRRSRGSAGNVPAVTLDGAGWAATGSTCCLK